MTTDHHNKKSEFDELLEQIPAYHRGELSPAHAHKLSLLLKENATFRAEAAREQLMVDTFVSMPEIALPRGLVAKAVKEAVGESATANWFSVDTLLVALGVGVGCAATAQFLSGKVEFLPTVGSWLGDLAGVAVSGSLGNLVGGVGIVSAALVLGGVFWTVRALRSRD